MASNLTRGQLDLRKYSDDGVARRREQQRARGRHRSAYWQRHDRDAFECPDCGHGPNAVEQIHVHHIDRNPFNGDLDNLVALCRRCHLKRHGNEPGRTLDEWKADFQALGEGEGK